MTRFIRLQCLALACLALSACYERHEWRQKLTVVVDTPDGQVSGSAVVQVNATYYGQLPATGTEVGYEVSGEATVVEVEPGKYLIAALGVAQGRIPEAFHEEFSGLSRREWLKEIPSLGRAARLPKSQMPRLLAFDGVGSIVTLQPEELSEFFGNGVSLNTVTLEVTDEPVTHGIASSLVERILNAPQGQLFSDDSGEVSAEISAANRELIFGTDLPIGEFVTLDRWRIE